MKKLCFNEKQKEYIGILGVVFFSLAVFMIISKGNLKFGLFIDNQTQWLPVIDKAYQTFFQTGRFPTIDFFQMQGMKIYGQGYYGSWNPFMLLAYVLRRYALSFLDTNTISVYIVMMIIFGNICCYKIFREAGLSVSHSVLLSVILMSVSIYTVLRYWYYVYNVYFILAWLLLRMIKRQSCYEYGAILALSLLMGNIQYTVYLYMVFFVIMMISFLRGEKKALSMLVSNSIWMGFLSSVPALLLMQASSSSVAFSESSSLYYSSAVHPVMWGIFSWIPATLLGDAGTIFEEKVYSGILMPDTTEFPGINGFYMGAVLCAAVIFVIQHKMYKRDRLYTISCACVGAAGILLLLSFGKAGILAIFAEQIPFLNRFRILAKYLVVLPPLLLPCTALVLREKKPKRNVYLGIILVFLVSGLIQNRELTFHVVKAQPQISVERLKELDADYGNYRIVGFTSPSEMFFVYPHWEDYNEREKISLEEKFANNMGSSANIITSGGYDTVFDYEQFKMSDAVLGLGEGLSDTEFSCRNLVNEEHFFLKEYNPENIDYHKNIERLRHQLVANSIKYFIFSKDSVYIQEFYDLLEEMKMEIEWQQPFMEHTVIISVKGIDSIVRTAEGDKVDATVEMDRITFEIEDSREIRAAMYYDKDLQVTLTDENGKTRRLATFPDADGHMIIAGESGAAGTVVICSYNKLYVFAQIWEIVVLVLLFIMLSYSGIKWIMSLHCAVEKKAADMLSCLVRISPQKGIWILFLGLMVFYVGFLGFYYLQIQCSVPDEEWFLQMMQTVRHMAGNNIFKYLSETENYLGYGQIYWILGSIFSNFRFLRAAAFVMLMGSMILVLREVRDRFGRQMIPYAGILWLSMPFAWYSDKIIGPELTGFFLGLAGMTVLDKKRMKWAGWGLLGISCAVKTYYAIFGLVALLGEMKRARGRRGAVLIEAGISGACGFIVGNPILLWDLSTFLENAQMKNKFLFDRISYIFGRREYEWDGVMVNGVFWGYASAFLLLVLAVMFIVSIRSNGYLVKSMAAAAAFLVLICCRAFFLGWYLLPLCYLIVMAACGLFDHVQAGKSDKKGIQWIFAACLFINAVILLPEHIVNRENNLAYVNVQKNSAEILETVRDMEEDLKKSCPDMPWYYLLDFHMEECSYNFFDYTQFCINGSDGIAVIGDRMRIAGCVDEIIQKAIKGEENLRILQQTEDVWIVQRGGS